MAEELDRRLMQEGFSVWFDKVRLKPGYDWHREIERGCESSRVILPILTPRWKLSEWTRFETYGAEAVIPLLAEGCWDEVTTPPLRRFQNCCINVVGSPAPAWQALFAAIREQLGQPTPEKARRVSHLKYRPNPYFVGREETLNQIHEKFYVNPTAALTQGRVEAVTALGGVGKTTIARQYVEKFWRCYEQILWVDCRNSLESEFAGLMELLVRTVGDEDKSPKLLQLKPAERADWVRSELDQADGRMNRLLILDNAEDEDSVRPWIPRSGNCHTLITSRFNGWSPGIETYSVWVLAPGPARDLLLLRVGRDGEGNPDIGACDELATKLGYLPLALEQAGAYIAKQGPGFLFADYLKLYTKVERELLDKGSRGSTEYPNAVYATWRTTMERLPAGSRAMLRLAGFLASTPIPFRMFETGAGVLAEEMAATMDGGAAEGTVPDAASVRELKDAIVDERLGEKLQQFVEQLPVEPVARERSMEQYIQVMATLAAEMEGATESTMPDALTVREWKDALVDYSMILPLAEETFLVHRLVQAVERLQVEPGARQLCLTRAVQLVADYGPRPSFEYQNWPVWKVLAPHGQALFRELKPIANSKRVAYLLDALASYLRSQGDYAAAEPLFLRAIEIWEHLFGPNHRDTLTSYVNLAGLLDFKGDYAEAETLYRRALAGLESVVGPDDRLKLGCINDLAALLARRGDYPAAEPLFRKVLAERQRFLDSDDPDTVTSLANLGDLLRCKRDYAAAEPLCRRALQGCERLYGSQHPTTLASANNLGLLLCSRGAHDEGERLLRKTLETKECILGRDHPDTLSSVNNLAGVLKGTDPVAADALYRRAVEGRERVLGREHPDTLESINGLAGLAVALHYKGDHARTSSVPGKLENLNVFPSEERPRRRWPKRLFSWLRHRPIKTDTHP